jgi:hypothetical protein
MTAAYKYLKHNLELRNNEGFLLKPIHSAEPYTTRRPFIFYKMLISNLHIHGNTPCFYIPSNLNYSHICDLSLRCCQFNCNLHSAVCVHLWLMVILLQPITNASYICQPVWPPSIVQVVLISHLLCRICGVIASGSFMLVTFCSPECVWFILNK